MYNLPGVIDEYIYRCIDDANGDVSLPAVSIIRLVYANIKHPADCTVNRRRHPKHDYMHTLLLTRLLLVSVNSRLDNTYTPVFIDRPTLCNKA